MGKKLVTIVIPVYNEESILEKAINELFNDIQEFRDRYDFEVILAENGSNDNTLKKGEELSKKFPNLSIFHYPEPDYGLALKEGIRRAKGEYVICDEIDLCFKEFYRSAFYEFENNGIDMVIGSKAMKGAKDNRPFKRRLATYMLNKVLRIILGFKGTDTHGVKAFKKEALMPVMEKCVIGKDIFASEFVIRAERAGIKIKEVPLTLNEKRAPSIRLRHRIPKALMNIMTLFWNIRIKKN
ncbi:MAG: glycosyltransferase [Candidatus Schekmanbacteria bacterium]|nr:MAG: glycosyltransferase [Candidatus Schekmanbacteria bacterium]